MAITEWSASCHAKNPVSPLPATAAALRNHPLTITNQVRNPLTPLPATAAALRNHPLTITNQVRNPLTPSEWWAYRPLESTHRAGAITF